MKSNIENVVFYIFLGLFFFLFIKLFSPFFYILLWSTIIFILLNPIYQWILNKLSKGKKLSPFIHKFLAGIFAFFAIVIIVVPLTFFFFSITNQLISFTKYSLEYLKTHPSILVFDKSHPLVEFVLRISNQTIDITTLNIKAEIINAIQKISIFILNNTTVLVKNVLQFFVSLLFMMFTLYFFFVDGKTLKTLFLKLIPINDKYLSIIITKFKESSYTVVMGYMVVALMQMLVSALLFALFGVKNFFVWSLLLFIASFIPMLGATAVWLPISLWVFFTQSYWKGILLFILCGIFISTVDNFIRPFIMKGKIKIHPLLIFFSLLGGILSFGSSGFVLGPLILILFFASIDIFIEIKKELK